jgi:hypothetical protein
MRRLNLIALCAVFFALVGNCFLYSQQTQIRFVPKLLTVDANEGIDLADVDGDGKLDVIAGRNWYAAPEFTPRPVRSISDWNGYVESNGDFAFDVNRDGMIDVISGSFMPSEVHWYENPGPAGLKLGATWKQHLLVDTKQSCNEATLFHDLDGDGIPEWITNSWKSENPLLAWRFEYPPTEKLDAGSASKVPSLIRSVLGVNGNSHGMGFGDVNNDGREDIVIATGWYERPQGDIWAAPWKFHADWEFLHASIPMLVCDLDGDGLNDIIWGKGHQYGLYWWKSNGVNAQGEFQYQQYAIDETYSQVHVLHLADLDGDGANELIAGKRVRAHNGGDPGAAEMPCMYGYRWNDSQKKFDRMVINEGRVGTGLQIRTGDLNGDQRLDIAVAGKDGTWILFNDPDKDSK